MIALIRGMHALMVQGVEAWCHAFSGWAPMVISATGEGAPNFQGWGNRFFNTGGPRSRTRKERIHASLFSGGDGRGQSLGVRRVGHLWGVARPENLSGQEKRGWRRGDSLREIALSVLDFLGIPSADEAFRYHQDIPMAALHARSVPHPENERGLVSSVDDPEAFLRVALVLGKCRCGIYDPQRPVIWTEKRLGQCVELYQIDAAFYQLSS